ncbi:hypothetical protein SAMN06265368_2571 [Cohaesibacter gelatinilyticus]|uniref:Uncharacterized protein n=1 Tax=Cohaesibacter gelatinilyticus TaxID=372072 RepID=A0A285PCP4_9HYPH|nr:hypothetical protein SAMN06265368_2571 [Cohaesibacter gelatinilyticus]
MLAPKRGWRRARKLTCCGELATVTTCFGIVFLLCQQILKRHLYGLAK